MTRRAHKHLVKPLVFVLAGAMLAYMLLRSLLLATIEAPETRYTLECFPMLIALGAMAFGPRKRAVD